MRIEQDDPELYKTLPDRLSATRKVPYGTIKKPYPNNPEYSYWEHTPEDRAYLEGAMWKLAAATWTEYMRTAELKSKDTLWCKLQSITNENTDTVQSAKKQV
jgi:hypothetical protein